jgi:hypothetical protein
MRLGIIFSIKSQGQLALYKQKNGKWSVKDYNNGLPLISCFESFDKFSPHWLVTLEGLLELKTERENVSYIETQLSTIPSISISMS